MTALTMDLLYEAMSLLPKPDELISEIWFVDRHDLYLHLESETGWHRYDPHHISLPTIAGLPLREWFTHYNDPIPEGYEFLATPGVWARYLDGHYEKLVENENGI